MLCSVFALATLRFQPLKFLLSPAVAEYASPSNCPRSFPSILAPVWLEAETHRLESQRAAQQLGAAFPLRATQLMSCDTGKSPCLQ